MAGDGQRRLERAPRAAGHTLLRTAPKIDAKGGRVKSPRVKRVIESPLLEESAAEDHRVDKRRAPSSAPAMLLSVAAAIVTRARQREAAATFHLCRDRVTKLRRASKRDRWIANRASDSASSNEREDRARPGILLHTNDGEVDANRQHFRGFPQQQRISEMSARLSMRHDQETRWQIPGA
jgi:hypothetical protein